ncbi:NADH-quinone oxidoreductase subunit F, partial [Halomonas sp. FL8]|nr:NADH-quinone oxidoreductase subunit F [Halomonas sp. FL8]
MTTSRPALRSSLRYRCQLRQPAAERRAETHPLTWRLHDDNSPVGYDEYLDKDGYAAVREVLGRQSPDEVIGQVK